MNNVIVKSSNMNAMQIDECQKNNNDAVNHTHNMNCNARWKTASVKVEFSKPRGVTNAADAVAVEKE